MTFTIINSLICISFSFISVFSPLEFKLLSTPDPSHPYNHLFINLFLISFPFFFVRVSSQVFSHLNPDGLRVEVRERVQVRGRCGRTGAHGGRWGRLDSGRPHWPFLCRLRSLPPLDSQSYHYLRRDIVYSRLIFLVFFYIYISKSMVDWIFVVLFEG